MNVRPPIVPRSTRSSSPAGEGTQAGGGVVPVQAQVQREAVAGAGADDQEGQAVFGGDTSHQRPRSRPRRPPRAGQRRRPPPRGPGRHIRRIRALQQDHLGAERLGFFFQPELGDHSPARHGVHDQERVPRGPGRADGRDGFVAAGTQRGPGGPGRSQHQRDHQDGDPDQAGRGERDQDDDRGGDHQDQCQPPQGLWVPRTSSSSRDQAIFVDQTTGASLSSDVVLLKIDRFG